MGLHVADVTIGTLQCGGDPGRLAAKGPEYELGQAAHPFERRPTGPGRGRDRHYDVDLAADGRTHAGAVGTKEARQESEDTTGALSAQLGNR
jgi:hypothetical protein